MSHHSWTIFTPVSFRTAKDCRRFNLSPCRKEQRNQDFIPLPLSFSQRTPPDFVLMDIFFLMVQSHLLID